MATPENDNVTQTIAELYPTLSKGHKKVAAYVLENRHQVAFMTLERLASEADVSRGTAERFARELGFSGYPNFRQQMAALVQESLMPVEKIRLGTSKQITPELALRSVLGEDIHNLEQTLQAISGIQFARALDLVIGANRVLIMGIGASAYLAGLLAYRLCTFRPDVTTLDESEEHAYRQLYWMGEKDLLIAISFPRYSRLTVETCQYARKKGVKVMAITDKLASPVYALADEALIATSERELLVCSPTVAVALIDAIVTAVAARDQRQTLDSISEVTNQLIDTDAYYMGEKKGKGPSTNGRRARPV